MLCTGHRNGLTSHKVKVYILYSPGLTFCRVVSFVFSVDIFL